jgi:23S rRNA pseudouridine1911/1915/1917 synthase
VSGPDEFGAALTPAASHPAAALAAKPGAERRDTGPRACAWPRRLVQGPARLITPEEFRAWVIHEDERLLVVDKPGDVVCHPSKHGPRSSLVGAAREHAGLDTIHLVFRLDRETSGIVVLAKDARMAARLQTAMQNRRVGKGYLAVLTGHLVAPARVDQPLGDDTASPVFIKTAVVANGRPAVTGFEPMAIMPGAETGGAVDGANTFGPGGAGVDCGSSGTVADAPTRGPGEGFTLVRVVPETGRKHQIRAHAQWLGHPVVGDKIYGPDARCYLDFIDRGLTPELAAKLLLPRQALHCARIDLRPAGLPEVFTAPLPADLRDFCLGYGLDAVAAGENWPESWPAADRRLDCPA